MSLIHEALKKAEQEKNPKEPNRPALSNPILADGSKKLRRPLVLVSLLVLSLGLFVYLRLIRKETSVPIPAPLQPMDPFQTETNPLLLKKLGLQLYQEQKLNESLATWEKLTLLLPTEAEVYNNMGLVLKKLGKKEEAFQAYTKALALKQDYPELLNNLGVLYLENGQRKEAKTHLTRAVELRADYPDPYLHLALLAQQEGNLDQAYQHYQKFLALSPSLAEELKQKVERKMNRLAK